MSEFQILRWEDAVTEGTEDWIIDGILSADTTLLYGEPKLGKSYFVCAMLAALSTGAETFLGRKVAGDIRPTVCWTDDRGWREYKKRMSGADEVRAAGKVDLSFVRLPVMNTVEQWQQLAAALRADGRNLVVIDNMTSAVEGSLNDDRTVRSFFSGVKVLTDAGLAVVVIAHASDAKDQYGRGGTRPQGHTLVSASVRWRCFMQRAKGHNNVKLSFSGNVADPHEITVHGDGMTYGVLGSKDAATLRVEKAERSRNRDKATLDRNADVARWLVDNCQGKSRRATASAVAAHFGGSVNTVRSHLSQRTAYGCLVTSTPGNGWTLAGPLAA